MSPLAESAWPLLLVLSVEPPQATRAHLWALCRCEVAVQQAEG